MGRAEEIQELINTNLCLLKAGGHRIDFKQNLFKEHNIVGFEAVGYALLKIIDPTECINTIPWPLVNDKAQSREFRTNFVKFIKMINTKYTDAKIPEINASSLQFPGGMRFLEFIYKLSTFAVEVEWKKMLSPEDQEDLLPKLIPCTMSSQKVQLAMVRGALCREVETLQRLADYQAEGPSVLKVMNDCLNNTKTSCESVSEKLKEEVSSLDLDDETKASLLNIDDSTAITDYNERTENKYEEIKKNCRKLSHLHNLAAQCCQREKLSMETECLDGHKLGLNRFSNKLVGGPMVNLKGDVKLLEVMRAAQTTINRLTSSSDSDSSSLLPPAQDLLVRCNSTVSRASKLEAALSRLLLENKQAVTTLRPRVYSTFDSNKIPEIFKHLQDRQPLNFLSPLSDIKEDKMVKRGSKRKSIGTIIQRKKIGVISYKTRREPRKHVSSTPFFKTPASRNSQNNSLSQKSQSSSTSRKSLNNTMLQFGLMHKEKDRLTPLRLTPKKKPVPNITEEKCDTDFYKCDEGNRHLEVTPDNVTVSSSAASSHGESVVSEPSPIPSLPPLPSVRRGRKSIDDIILRYRRLKQSQSSSYTSKNESDTCNESES